jgi:hypothetical protein
MFKCPIPGEVAAYLRDAAHGIITVAQNPPKPAQRPVAIAKALSLHKDGAGQGSVFKDYSTRLKNRDIALAVVDSKYYEPGFLDGAFADVSEQTGRSKATVRRIFLAHSKRWRLMAEMFIANEGVTFDADGNPTRRVGGTAEDLQEFSEILKEVKRIKDQA